MIENQIYHIYGIKRIGSDDFVYVGVTNNPKRRAWGHRKRFGKDIKLVLLEVGEPDCWNYLFYGGRAERWWVEFLLSLGHPLENVMLTPKAA